MEISWEERLTCLHICVGWFVITLISPKRVLFQNSWRTKPRRSWLYQVHVEKGRENGDRQSVGAALSAVLEGSDLIESVFAV